MAAPPSGPSTPPARPTPPPTPGSPAPPTPPTPLGVENEVAPLRAVLVHRPGAELRRLTPRNNADLLFDAIPWVDGAQQEHDAFTDVLRDAGARVLELDNLLTDVLATDDARRRCIDAACADPSLGATLRQRLAAFLADLPPAELTAALVAGVGRSELPTGAGLRWRLMHEHEFVVPPLPNLLFTRDSSVWIGDRVVVTTPSMPARRREASLVDAVYRHHPTFAAARPLVEPGPETLEGGDVLLLAPGVLAIGVGQRTTAAGAERLARAAFAEGLARVVLAVPISQRRATMHLDTVFTLVDEDAAVMYPNLVHDLIAHRVTPHEGDPSVLHLGPPQPFVEAAADAMGIDRLRVIPTGLDPVVAEREQWDDGNNTLALAPGRVVAYARNVETNARLTASGVEVIEVAGSELGSGRGGPRCLSCPLERERVSR